MSLVSCGKDAKDGKDGVTPTIEISDDGYWVINGEKTDVSAVAKPKKFVVGEEIYFANGEEFTVYGIVDVLLNDVSIYTITSAKLVAVEEIPLNDPSKWAYQYQYIFSYKYRMYVTGYAPIEQAGSKFEHVLRYRTGTSSGIDVFDFYADWNTYESTIVGEDGYFEYSVDVHSPCILTNVYPVNMS